MAGYKTLVIILYLLASLKKILTEENSGCIERSLVGRNRLNISDSSYTASSYLYDYRPNTPWNRRYVPQNAKLYGPWGWSPHDNSRSDYLQLDLGTAQVITAVETQGNGGKTPGKSTYKEWILEYKLWFKNEETSEWLEYKNTINNYVRKHRQYWYQKWQYIYKGQTMTSDTVVRYNITQFQTARYIRFIPLKYHECKTMRVNVYVIDQEAPRVTATPSERSMLVRWTMKCMKITGFIVNVNSKGSNKVFKVGHVTTYNITGLQPYTEYQIRVKGVPHGVWSESKTVRTNQSGLYRKSPAVMKLNGGH